LSYTYRIYEIIRQSMAGGKVSNKRKTGRSEPEYLLVAGMAAVIFRFFRWLIGRFLRRSKTVTGKSTAFLEELAILGKHWPRVEQQLQSDTTRSLAISEADKILDQALRLYGVSGDSTGERLQSARNLFSKDVYERIWSAHKLRNTVAHEVGAKVSAQEAKTAIAGFRLGLYQLKVLQ
ncbi:hypothetical protein KGQ71_01240, partial [Patescibacteria group bacterium]|nr:hypothetical protein [Patescibacteria group bacterium]